MAWDLWREDGVPLDWRSALGGLALGAAATWLAMPHGWQGGDEDRPWALPEFQFPRDDPDGFVEITGTLMGKGVGYPMNTWEIRCVRREATCRTSDVEQIGRDQLGRISNQDWPVATWTDHVIVAQTDPSDTSSCGRATITINMDARSADYVSVPQNADKDYCKRFNRHPRTYEWKFGSPRQPWDRTAS